MKSFILICIFFFSGVSGATGLYPNTYHFNDVKLEPLSELYEATFRKEFPYPSTFYGFLLDLNGDKTPEYFVKWSAGEHCKNCWFILDGLKGVEIAYFNGVVEVSGDSSLINAFPVFEIYDEEENTLKIYVYSGKIYELVSCVLVDERGVPVSCNSISGKRVPVQMLKSSKK